MPSLLNPADNTPNLHHLTRPPPHLSLPSSFVDSASTLSRAIVTALLYPDSTAMALPFCTATATDPSSWRTITSRGQRPKCSSPARLSSFSSVTASGASPPQVCAIQFSPRASITAIDDVMVQQHLSI